MKIQQSKVQSFFIHLFNLHMRINIIIDLSAHVYILKNIYILTYFTSLEKLSLSLATNSSLFNSNSLC